MPYLQKLETCLKSLPEVELAVLFGSQARSKGGRRSDIDVAVKLTQDSGELRRAVRNAIVDAVNRTVDIVFLPGPPLLEMEIARHGRVLVERQAHTWANFKARAMIAWCDWAPHADRIWGAALKKLREEVTRGSA